jgi:hypothetical protein
MDTRRDGAEAAVDCWASNIFVVEWSRVALSSSPLF